MKEKVLQAMREFGAPVNAGKIAEITGIDRKEVDKAFAELKKEGAIAYALTAAGVLRSKSHKIIFKVRERSGLTI